MLALLCSRQLPAAASMLSPATADHTTAPNQLQDAMMKNARRTKKLSMALAVLLAANPLLAETNNAGALLPPPPSAPLTLWNFLGIPQGFNKIRDVTTNRTGNHPGLERKPPPRAIADFRNLESPNPAIKKAAEIKAEEDLAPQKIKA